MPEDECGMTGKGILESQSCFGKEQTSHVLKQGVRLALSRLAKAMIAPRQLQGNLLHWAGV
jgi:hypothetical protein